MTKFRIETDSLGEVKVPADKLWGAQTERSLKYFNIGDDLMPHELVVAYAILKKAAALANFDGGCLALKKKDLIVAACDEILVGKHRDMFPLHVWMTGSGTQLNMNLNEVIANRASQLANQPLGSKKPLHPNDDVNLSQSSNDTFPSAMYMAAALQVTQKLIPALTKLWESFDAKALEWKDIIKIGRTHLQDATPLTLGQEFSGYAGMLEDNLGRLHWVLEGLYALALGGTAVGTGIGAASGFDQAVAAHIARLTQLPFISAPNKFTVQGSHDSLVQLSATLKTLACSLYKIAQDIMLLASGPRSGFNELILPANEPGSSIMPGKVNPTQCEALAMVALQVMANDVAVGFGGASGYLEMNSFKPLMIFNVLNSLRLLSDAMHSFNEFLVAGMQSNTKQIANSVSSSLMLVTALTPKIGYDKAAQIAHYALTNDLSLKEAALQLEFVAADEFDEIVNPEKMV